MRHPILRRAALGVVGALALAACQTTLSLNTDNLEQVIQTGIQGQNPGLTISAVGCPERPLQQGDIFECTATTSDGRTLTITVTQTDATGHVNWEVTSTS